jgi:NitT/TauT family transport system ATP-binding protein/nitrate/nitrite transport system substrate-binding protein
MGETGTMSPQPGEGPIVIGLLRLTDAAPVIVAAENGYFAKRGLDVRLSVEPSWANIADKLTYGRLNAAVILPPLAFAVSLGLRGIGTPLVVPMSLSLNGSSVTLSGALADAVAPDSHAGAMQIGARLRKLINVQGRRLRFSVVHIYSTHNLLLRYWLAAVGIDPDRDVELSIVSPAETVAALHDGHIDGFCAGAPWGSVAAASGVGRIVVTSSQIWRDHPEKCIALPRSWALANPERLGAMIDALIEAAQFCDDPANGEAIAHMLADRRYLALDREAIRESLPAAAAPIAGNVDRSVFFSHAANFPWRSHAAWFLGQMARWGHLPPELDRQRAAAVYRPDLFRAAAMRAGISVPVEDVKAEGAHETAWIAEGRPSGIPMGPDVFCDRAVFETESG